MPKTVIFFGSSPSSATPPLPLANPPSEANSIGGRRGPGRPPKRSLTTSNEPEGMPSVSKKRGRKNKSQSDMAVNVNVNVNVDVDDWTVDRESYSTPEYTSSPSSNLLSDPGAHHNPANMAAQHTSSPSSNLLSYPGAHHNPAIMEARYIKSAQPLLTPSISTRTHHQRPSPPQAKSSSPR